MKLREFADTHVWDTCLRCGADYAVKRDATLHVHGPRNDRCSGSNSYGTRAQKILAEAK